MFAVGLLGLSSVTNQMKTATEQSFSVVLFIALYRVALTSESVDEILKCAYPNERITDIEQYFLCGTVYCTVQDGSTVELLSFSAA